MTFMLQIAYFFAWIISFFNPKVKKWILGQQLVFEKLELAFKSNQKPTAWFHCASLGEYEQAKPVIEAFKKNYPAYQIVITFFSPSGYENVHQEFVFFLPLDTAKNALRFIKIVQPKIAFFVKYDFWPNYLSVLQNKQIPAIAFSAIFRPNQVYFKYRFFKQILTRFDVIFIQNLASKKLLESIGIQNCIINSDTRFDAVLERKNKPKINLFLNEKLLSKKTILLGSIYEEDMKILIPFINQNADFNYLIFPHEINLDSIQKWGKQLDRKFVLFSENQMDCPIVFVDKIGLLADAYQWANYAYIGGGFSKGIHNVLEAAVYGIPVFFGDKNYTKFEEAKDLIALKVAFPINNTADLLKNINHFERNPLELKKTSEICSQYFEAKKGATAGIMAYLKQINF
jgi:3-deoxy-D-manno-octulosonic-acid transferase